MKKSLIFDLFITVREAELTSQQVPRSNDAHSLNGQTRSAPNCQSAQCLYFSGSYLTFCFVNMFSSQWPQVQYLELNPTCSDEKKAANLHFFVNVAIFD